MSQLLLSSLYICEVRCLDLAFLVYAAGDGIELSALNVQSEGPACGCKDEHVECVSAGKTSWKQWRGSRRSLGAGDACSAWNHCSS